jgi:hypothetical protein
MTVVVCLMLNISLYRILNFNLAKLTARHIKKVNTVLFYLIPLLCSVVIMNCSTSWVDAQTDSTITITSNGDVVGTDKIRRNGDVYTLTGNIFDTIKVEKDSITIDGAGYTIRAKGYGINLKQGTGIDFAPAYGGVVVKNVRFYGCSILASANNNLFTNNRFEEGGIEIRGIDSDKGTVVKQNVFINTSWGIFVDYTRGNVATGNDFINSKIYIALYGQLDVNKNYWSIYTDIYPDAEEKGRTGVWNTPYRFERYDWNGFSFVDYSPLVRPVGGFKFPVVEVEPEPTPTTIPETKNNPDYFTTTLIMTTMFAMVVVGTGLLVYFKKHKISRTAAKNQTVPSDSITAKPVAWA